MPSSSCWPLVLPHCWQRHDESINRRIAGDDRTGTVAYQRAASDSNWASDAVVGAAWGYAVARIVVAGKETRHLSVGPAPAPEGAPGVSLSFSFQSTPWEGR